jgi:hypothetical protein
VISLTGDWEKAADGGDTAYNISMMVCCLINEGDGEMDAVDNAEWGWMFIHLRPAKVLYIYGP